MDARARIRTHARASQWGTAGAEGGVVVAAAQHHGVARRGTAMWPRRYPPVLRSSVVTVRTVPDPPSSHEQFSNFTAITRLTTPPEAAPSPASACPHTLQPPQRGRNGDNMEGVEASAPRAAATAAAAPSPSTTVNVTVRNLHPSVTSKDVNDLFSDVGPVRAAFVRFAPDGQSRGVATVKYQRYADAAEALRRYQGVPLDGQEMQVSIDATRLGARTGGGGGGAAATWKRGAARGGNTTAAAAAAPPTATRTKPKSAALDAMTMDAVPTPVAHTAGAAAASKRTGIQIVAAGKGERRVVDQTRGRNAPRKAPARRTTLRGTEDERKMVVREDRTGAHRVGRGKRSEKKGAAAAAAADDSDTAMGGATAARSERERARLERRKEQMRERRRERRRELRQAKAAATATSSGKERGRAATGADATGGEGAAPPTATTTMASDGDGKRATRSAKQKSAADLDRELEQYKMSD